MLKVNCLVDAQVLPGNNFIQKNEGDYSWVEWSAASFIDARANLPFRMD